LKKGKRDWEKNLVSRAEGMKVQEEKLVTDDKVSTSIIASNISNRLKQMKMRLFEHLTLY